MEETKTYWNGNGKHQELYNAQWDELVPGNGKAGTMQGEVLRAASRLYYRWFNDGDRIQQYGQRTDSSAEDAWAFLHEAHTLLPGDEGKFAARDTITNTLAALHASYASGVNAPNGGGVGRFDGYFKVDKENAGQWTFTGKYGNQIALDVDGRRLFAATANDAQVSARMTLAEGWHKFDVRVGNNATNTTDVSGGKLTDADGNVCSLMFRVGDGVNHSFDERYLPIAYTTGVAQKFERPGLSGEIELAAGSSLTNAPQKGGWCPIYGTLKGTGTLSGPFRFTGDDNCWEVTGAS